jgi:DNA-binding transcriptional MerR regulator
MFFKIGEVSKILDVDPHVLRFWESEFKQLNPTKNKKGQRVYQKKDVETAILIKKLLYEEKFTIAGAKNQLRGKGDASAKKGGASQGAELDKSGKKYKILLEVKKGLQDILVILKKR